MVNMMNKSIIIFVMVFMFSIVMISAEEYIPHKQNTAFDLVIQTDNATACNFTYIQYPNGVKTLFNKVMTKDSKTFYTNISAGNYSQLGVQCHGVTCTDGSTFESGNICREITPSGFASTATFFFIYIIIIGLVFLIGVTMRNTWVMTLGSILVLLFGFFIIRNGVDLIKDTQTTWAIGLVVWALGIYFLYLSAEEQLKEWN